MGAPLTLALPTIVTNPAGIATSITWLVSPQPPWLSLTSSIVINSADTSLAGTTTVITITAKDLISGLSVSHEGSILFKCIIESVDCSASFSSDITYFITEATTITILACKVTPSFCPNTSIGTLTSNGASVPGVEFASMTKNGDNTFTIAISSSNLSIAGVTYTY